MKKIGICLMCLLCVLGCQRKEVVLNQPVKLMFFYVETCSQCQAFKKHALPLLEDTFNDSIQIELYDLDEESTRDVYDCVIDRLDSFDYEYYGNGPFIVVDGYFALLGYNRGDEEFLVQDIQKVTSGKELGYELEGYRFLYK